MVKKFFLKSVMFIICFFFLVNIVFSNQTSQYIKINFNVNNNSEITSTVLSNDFVLELNTNEKAICKYSEENELNYTQMLQFEDNYEILHRKYFFSLPKGKYIYYIKCANQNSTIFNGTLKVNIYIDELISAEIILEKEILKAGQHEIILKTNTIPLDIPSLSYTIDGVNYQQVPLYGSEKNWKGYLIIQENIGEKTASFKFSAKDLLGRTGTRITKNNFFLIDTKKPAPITSLSYKVFENQIRLDWYYEDDFEEFFIYRTTTPFVSYTDYYKKTNNKYFIDNDVESGKTYYYRVAAVDKAGNIGDLSKEISAIPISSNISLNKNRLNQNLLGLVENFLTRIESLEDNIKEINSKIEEKEIAEKIGILSEIELSKKDLINLKKEVESYKNQELTRDELEKKLNSAEIKLESIKKRIPESISIEKKEEFENNIDEEKMKLVLAEYYKYNPEKNINNIQKASIKTIKDNNINFKTNIFLLYVNYLDGNKKEITFVQKKISSGLERNKNITIIIFIPEDLGIKEDEIIIKNKVYDKINKDFYKFESDTKEINYLLNKAIDFEKIKRIEIFLINEERNQRNLFTGNVIGRIKEDIDFSYVIPSFLIIISLIAVLIFPRTISYREIKKMFNQIKEKIDKNEKEEARKLYSKIKENYKNFNDFERRIAYNEFKKIESLLKK